MSKAVEQTTYIDKYSSGDSKNMQSKRYQEENNNEVDELSKDLSEMGCIVDAVKRPPNICVETCVYVSEGEQSETESVHGDDDAYTDEFEDDKSEGEESIGSLPKSDLVSAKSNSSSSKDDRDKLKIVPSSISSIKGPTMSGRSTGRSSSFGSVSVPKTRRVNMSFSNDRLREIERHNHILLSKILSARNKKSSIPPPKDPPVKKQVASSNVTRKNQQKKIDHDNMILLKKIQRVKSSAHSIRR